jgi:EAL domain-containing protein (putative c-di-GMP-specific phosphodiesterase class I)
VQFLNGNLVQEVERALAISKLPAHRLELEITESVMLQDNHDTLSTLNQLHNLGVSISMDDFGTGYSSLSYLRQFPFDKIKIDQSFVRNLAEKKGSIAIIRAVVGLGKALGMEVLAEGVETEEQFNILLDEGCDELQGYLFSKPHPVQDVQEMVDRYPTGAQDQGAGSRLESAQA